MNRDEVREMTGGPMEEVLDRWKAAFDGHQVEAMADLFTPDALFQGFGPEVVTGRDAVHDYYESVPGNRSAEVTLLHTYTIGQEVAGGFADVTFRDPTGWAAPVHLSLVLQLTGGTWRIRQYHVSRISQEH